MNKVVSYIKSKNLIKKYCILFFALFVAAINYNLFMSPLRIVAGGTNGLSILVESFFNVSPSIFILIFSVLVLVASFIFLGIEKTSSAVVTSFVYPFFVSLTSNVSLFLDLGNIDRLLVSFFVGVITGWVSGTICKIGMSQGGVVLISQIVYEKLRISISKVNFLINFVIVGIGGLYFGMSTVLYAIIVIYVSSSIMNRTLLGTSSKKAVYLITSKKEEVEKYLIDQLGCGVTCFKTTGIDGSIQTMIFTVVPTSVYTRITSYVKSVDKNAFCVVVDSYQTVGGA